MIHAPLSKTEGSAHMEQVEAEKHRIQGKVQGRQTKLVSGYEVSLHWRVQEWVERSTYPVVQDRQWVGDWH